MFDKKAWAKKYYEANKAIIIQRATQWNKDHKDKHNEYSYKSKKDIINGMDIKDYRHNYYETHKNYWKEYREKHKDKIKAYMKAYAKKRKELIKDIKEKCS